MLRTLRVATMLLALALPVGVPSGAADDATDLQCVNAYTSSLAHSLTVFATLADAVGVGVSADQPGDGLAAKVVVVPSKCGVGGGLPDLEGATVVEPRLPSAEPLDPVYKELQALA